MIPFTTKRLPIRYKVGRDTLAVPKGVQILLMVQLCFRYDAKRHTGRVRPHREVWVGIEALILWVHHATERIEDASCRERERHERQPVVEERIRWYVQR